MIPPRRSKNQYLQKLNVLFDLSPIEAEPVIDFQAEMRAVRQRMQEEYARGVSLRQLKVRIFDISKD